jgi:predicted O-methyltransferase YrrM
MAPLVLRYVAALNRVVPPKATGFRYLELGCGLGRSLTTLAAANPDSEFVGVDINPQHTAAVEKDVAAGRLDNVRVITSDFGKLPGDLGKYEFITLHGILSRVSQQVREDILAVAKERLAPGGLLLVSYNAMPGWAHLQPIRGILKQYAALRQGDSLQRVRDALAYLVFIRDKKARYFEANPQASAYVDGLLNATGEGSAIDGVYYDTATCYDAPGQAAATLATMQALQAAAPDKIVGFHTGSDLNEGTKTLEPRDRARVASTDLKSADGRRPRVFLQRAHRE